MRADATRISTVLGNTVHEGIHPADQAYVSRRPHFINNKHRASRTAVMSLKDSMPNLTSSQASELVSQIFGLIVSEVKPLPSYDDQNFYVRVSDGVEYVLKILNSTDSENLTLVEMQTYIMAFLHQHGLPVQTAIPTCTGQLMSLQTIAPQKSFMKLGKWLQQWMKSSRRSVLERKNFIWNLSSTPLLESYLHVMDGDPMQQLLKDVIQQYKSHVLPNLDSFRKCINHGDFNDHNILVEHDGLAGYKISGILDFGDMSSGYYVFELAITIMYMMIESANAIDVGGPVLAGWESVFPLNEAERNALYFLVLCRFCQSLVLARRAITLYPENEEYLMTTARTGVRHLQQLWELGKEQVERRWFDGAKEYLKTHPGTVPLKGITFL
ncbi:hydroxylysine kinase isoform X2 [Scleropages formosus]|uniref:hydroxylysine kinase isoform X2 n=1 Tax=Scleropages formosus TaxID=113540 RepID=UPI000878ADDB|nr:hydroxylysine kinase isoform X2 [Scleropages formosus]